MARPDYGVDAPDVVRNLLGGGLLLIGAGAALRVSEMARFSVGLLLPGAWFTLLGALMLHASLRGKPLLRDRLLGLARISPGMLVVDVGCGRGLLAVGAARLGARAVGVDVFRSDDLSDNTLERAQSVVREEGVQVDLRREDARELHFESGSVDRVLSNLCLHNLYVALDREHALAEIVRVLKPGGVAVISDAQHVDEYAWYFRAKGLRVHTEGPYVLESFPWLRAVVAEKPAS